MPEVNCHERHRREIPELASKLMTGILLEEKRGKYILSIICIHQRLRSSQDLADLQKKLGFDRKKHLLVSLFEK